MKLKGYIYAAIAAAAYGTNPIFAKPLYAEGMNPDSVLLFRYLLALILMGVIMLGSALKKHKSIPEAFHVGKHSLPQLVLMGLLMSASSILLFMSYNFISGSLCTLSSFTQSYRCMPFSELYSNGALSSEVVLP